MAAKVSTFDGNRPLNNAAGIYFERGKQLFLVTSRHVVFDALSRHFPDRLEIELHLGLENVAGSTVSWFRSTALAAASGARRLTAGVTSMWRQSRLTAMRFRRALRIRH